MVLNLYAAWIGFILGCVSGAIPGLFFYKEDWLGGYNSWQRRLVRLAHISFFGIGLINMGLAVTVRTFAIVGGIKAASTLLIIGAVAMPTVCYLSAWKDSFRHLFFIPALSVTVGIALFVWRLLSI